MTDFDPTTNRIPFGLLTPQEQIILKEWPHGFEFYESHEPCDCPMPFWSSRTVYRGKPAPEVAFAYLNIYLDYRSIDAALHAAADDSVGMVCVEFVDGKPIAARVVKGDET